MTSVERRCAVLAAQYEADNRGFQLVRVAGGYRYQSHPDQVAYVERYVLDGQAAKLSAAALETLAIVAVGITADYSRFAAASAMSCEVGSQLIGGWISAASTPASSISFSISSAVTFDTLRCLPVVGITVCCQM